MQKFKLNFLGLNLMEKNEVTYDGSNTFLKYSNFRYAALSKKDCSL